MAKEGVHVRSANPHTVHFDQNLTVFGCWVGDIAVVQCLWSDVNKRLHVAKSNIRRWGTSSNIACHPDEVKVFMWKILGKAHVRRTRMAFHTFQSGNTRGGNCHGF